MRSTRLTAIALAVCAVAAEPAAGQSTQDDASSGISVTGTATVTATPDTARYAFRVAGEGRTPRAALRRMSAKSRRVIAAVQRVGIPDADIRTGEVSVFKFTKRPARRRRPAVFRQRAVTSVRVETQNVDATGRAIDAGVSAGAASVDGPRFFLADPYPQYEDALAAAFDQARRKAQRLADRAGVTLGRAVRIRERGGDAFSDPDSEQFQQGAGGGPARPRAVPVRPGLTKIRADLSVTFATS